MGYMIGECGCCDGDNCCNVLEDGDDAGDRRIHVFDGTFGGCIGCSEDGTEDNFTFYALHSTADCKTILGAVALPVAGVTAITGTGISVDFIGEANAEVRCTGTSYFGDMCEHEDCDDDYSRIIDIFEATTDPIVCEITITAPEGKRVCNVYFHIGAEGLGSHSYTADLVTSGGIATDTDTGVTSLYECDDGCFNAYVGAYAPAGESIQTITVTRNSPLTPPDETMLAIGNILVCTVDA